MIKKLGYLVIVLIFMLTSSGCATIVHGTSTTVRINSIPQGATALVGGQTVITPSTLNLKNNQTYNIVFKKDGYEDTYYTIDKQMSGWVWGNIALGGIIGLLIDNMTGGAYKLVPTDVNVTLTAKK